LEFWRDCMHCSIISIYHITFSLHYHYHSYFVQIYIYIFLYTFSLYESVAIFFICNTQFVLFTVFHMWDSLYLFLTLFHVWTNHVFLHYVFTCESFCCYPLTVFSHVKSLYFIVLISAVHAHSMSHVNTSLSHIWIHWVILLLLFSLHFTCELTCFTCEKTHCVEASLGSHTWSSEPLSSP
jgi:hypothetical protein